MRAVSMLRWGFDIPTSKGLAQDSRDGGLHAYFESRLARSVKSRRQLGNQTRRAIPMIVKIRKQLRFFGSTRNVHLQGVVLFGKTIKVDFISRAIEKL